MTNPARNTVLLELHVPDFEPVKEYYGYLGFNVVRETKPDEKRGYLVLQMEANVLCFWAGNEYVYNHSFFGQFPHDTPRGYAVEIVLMVKDIDAYYRDVRNHVDIVRQLEKRAWGLKDFRVQDPFGYYLRITSLHNVLEDGSVFQ